MTFEWLIQTYGYPALLAGTFLEGETILVIAGFAAYRGYLSLPWVILVAFIGSFSGDQFWFLVGRTKGRSWLEKRPRWRARGDRVQALLARYQYPVMLGFRFVYGIRNLTPLIIGAGGYPGIRFFLLNAAGAALWSVTIAGAGYFFGEAMEVFLADVRRYERIGFILIAVIGAGLWGWHLWRCRKQDRARS